MVGYQMADELGETVQADESELEEIRRDIGAIVSRLDRLIAAEKDLALQVGD